MKIINHDTGVMLEASEEVARGYLQNPAYAEVAEEELPAASKAGNKTTGKKEA